MQPVNAGEMDQRERDGHVLEGYSKCVAGLRHADKEVLQDGRVKFLRALWNMGAERVDSAQQPGRERNNFMLLGACEALSLLGDQDDDTDDEKRGMELFKYALDTTLITRKELVGLMGDLAASARSLHYVAEMLCEPTEVMYDSSKWLSHIAHRAHVHLDSCEPDGHHEIPYIYIKCLTVYMTSLHTWSILYPGDRPIGRTYEPVRKCWSDLLPWASWMEDKSRAEDGPHYREVCRRVDYLGTRTTPSAAASEGPQVLQDVPVGVAARTP